MLITTTQQIKQLKHGQKIKFDFGGYFVDDAKISINKDGNIFICNNVMSVFNADDNLGYKHTYILYDANWDKNYLPELLFTVGNLEKLEVGDILVNDKGYERNTLAILNNTVVLLSDYDDFDTGNTWYTFDYLDKNNWNSKQLD